MTKSCRQVYHFSKKEVGGVTVAAAAASEGREGEGRQRDKTKKKKKTQQAALYKGHSEEGERENSEPYRPCHHPGQPCTLLTCSCRQTNNFCEKFCLCSLECNHRLVVTVTSHV